MGIGVIDVQMWQTSKRLEEVIRQRIMNSQTGMIPFHEFMHLALYHPVCGYYMNENTKIGKTGDFYTVASLPVFAEMFTRYIVERHDAERLVIVEFGAGTGKIAKDILNTIQELVPEVYANCRYELVETSPFHRAKQLEQLQEHQSHIEQFTPEQWFLNGTKKQVVLWSNELFDAFPVDRIRAVDGIYEQAFVTWDQDAQKFNWFWKEPDEKLLQYLDRFFVYLKDYQIADISLSAVQFFKKIIEALEDSWMMHVDYGFETDEMFAPYRMVGSMRCFYQHTLSDDPFVRVGEQDITAHVHFSALMDIARDANWKVEPLIKQAEWLVEAGILNQLQDDPSGDPTGPIARKNRMIRQMVLGDSMGETFRVFRAGQTSHPLRKT